MATDRISDLTLNNTSVSSNRTSGLNTKKTSFVDVLGDSKSKFNLLNLLHMFTAFSVLLTLFTFLATFNAPALHVKTAYWKLDAGDNNPDITPYGVFLAIGLCLSFIGVIVYSILAFVNKKTKRLFKYRYTHLTFYTALAFLTLIVFVVGVCDKITYDVNGNINNLYLFAYNPDLEGWTLTNAGKAAVGILGSLFIITTIGYLLVISSLVKLPSLKVNVKIGKAK